MSDAAAAVHGDGHHVNYMAKFWWLVGLTIVEVAAAVFVPLPFKLALLAFFALWKAGIVLRYFMHLKTEGIALKLAMLFPVLLMVILFTLFLVDSQSGYAAL